MSDGKVAVVTGSAKRLGKAILLELAKNGINVVVHYNKSSKEALAVRKEAESYGVKAIVIKADLTNPKEVEEMFKKVYSHFRRIDILINNASSYLIKNLKEVNVDEWKYQLDSTLNSIFYCCKFALPYMRKNKFGRIINLGTGSIEELSSKPNTTAYQIAKTGVLILTKSLAVEEAKNNITVNVISPGLLFNSNPMPKEGKKLIPAGRFGKFEDITNAVLFLIKEESNYITGTNIKVTGGYKV